MTRRRDMDPTRCGLDPVVSSRRNAVAADPAHAPRAPPYSWRDTDQVVQRGTTQIRWWRWCGSPDDEVWRRWSGLPPSLCLLVRRRAPGSGGCVVRWRTMVVVLQPCRWPRRVVVVVASAAVGARTAGRWAGEPGPGFLGVFFYEIVFAES
jgi:hypothetical protein